MDPKKAGEEQVKSEVPPRKRRRGRMHPAGPHARPELTDPEATPGTGALPDISADRDIDPGSE